MRILKITLILIGLISLSFSYVKAEVDSSEPGKRLIIHTVKGGEELHLLAGYYLLNSREWYKIHSWNSHVISNTNRINPGQELIVYVNNDWQPPYNLDEYLVSIGRR
jgi:hypothetical protein